MSFNAAAYTINSTAAMEFSMDNGASWAVCKDNMDVSYFGGSVLLVRYAATENSFRSNITNVFVPTRSEAPALIVDLKTERINTTSAMEYSDNGGASWKPCTPDMSVSALAGETIMVRKKATPTTPAGESAFVNIPERAEEPSYNILMLSETLTSDAPFEYYLNGTWTKTESLVLSDLCGQTILIQAAAGDGKFASSRVSVQVPLRGEAPVVEIEESSLTINTAIGMEFSVDNGSTWNPAGVNMDISSYSGMVILVRRTVTETMFVSPSAAVRIRSLAAAPDIQVDTVKETVNTTAGMEYSTDGGSTWIPASDEMSVSDLSGGTIEVRLCGTDKEFPSTSISISIPERNNVPEVTADLKLETFTVTAGTEYSDDGGATWPAAPSTISDSMYGKTLLFRSPADSTHFSSVFVPVALPARPDGPAAVFNMKTMSVNTASDMEYSVDSGLTWKEAPNGLDVSGLQGKILRYAATLSLPASSVTALEIPNSASAPVVSVDCMSEQLISSEPTLEWSQDNGKTWTVSKVPMYVGDYADQKILFRVPATVESPASASVPVMIPSRASVPNVDVDINSETINTTSAMEYSLNGGLSWTPAPTNLDVSGMTGDAVLVRIAYTNNSFASLPLSVGIPTRANRAEISIDMNKETLNTTSSMDY
ncbi:MAG: hypothetical protein K2O18_06340, partial [Oscillospiraceae bacterium]|nr:hypothetical protein [Oscillospiraceae bacterium]